MRIFLIVSKNTTVNKQCSYINQQTNEVLIDNLDTCRYTDGLTPVVTILQNYFASICPIFEINPSDVSIPFSELVVKRNWVPEQVLMCIAGYIKVEVLH